MNGYNIAELSAMKVDELVEVVEGITDPAVAPLVRTLTERLHHLVEIGLEYLSLDRLTDTLSGGEAQRVKIVKQANSVRPRFQQAEPISCDTSHGEMFDCFVEENATQVTVEVLCLLHLL